MSSRLKALLNRFSRVAAGLSADAVIVMLAASVLLVAYQYNGSSAFFRMKFMPYISSGAPLRPLYPAFYWYGCSFLLLGLVPYLLMRLVLGFDRRQTGASAGDWRFGLKAAAGLYLAFLPLLVAASFLPEMRMKYPLYPQATSSVGAFLAYEAAYVVYFIGWEFIFRGFLLFGLEPAIGAHSIFVQTIPFALLHFGKPEIESLAAVAAGVILGWLALRTRSFWYGWLLHSAVAVTNDVLAWMHQVLGW
ncbi:MAG: CPBP family intramembrane metalloprotease [Deltaproteobacteria bacterium]|nr:MAG: CPBP family intramembrane metalloprotease [Deltaproteobacteria bacterium]